MKTIFKGKSEMTTSFEQVRHGLGADVTRRQIIAAAAREGAAEGRARWATIFAQIPPARHKMATLLLGDPRCTLTDEEIVTACRVGHAPAVSDSSLATLSEPMFDSPTSRRESELASLGVAESCRLLGKPIPDHLPALPRSIPRTGRGYQIDPALQDAALALGKRLGPITCQS
jgi:hypothetical protein